MNGNEVCLDTNQAIAVLNDSEDAGEWVQAFDAVYLPVPVLGELRFGALKSRRASENLGRIAELAERCTILEVRESTTEVYARTRLQLRRKGRPLPENDVWIAALCIEQGLPLATADAHFAEVEGLTVISR